VVYLTGMHFIITVSIASVVVVKPDRPILICACISGKMIRKKNKKRIFLSIPIVLALIM